MLEILGIKNKLDNVEKELEELGALGIQNACLLNMAKVALIKIETILEILNKEIKEIKEIKEGEIRHE